MATGSDIVYEHVCSPCEQDGLNYEATHYCKNCAQIFCGNCVKLHNKVLRNHVILGHREDHQWFTVVPNFPKDHVFTVKSEREVNIRVAEDEEECKVNDICCTPNGDILVADCYNRRLKILNKDYAVRKEIPISKPFRPIGICHIKRNEFAALLGDAISKRKVMRLVINNYDKVTLNDGFTVNHMVYSILYDQSAFYIASKNNIHVYTMEGLLINVLRNVTSDGGFKFMLCNNGHNFQICPNGKTTIFIDKDGRKQNFETDEDLIAFPGGAVHANGALFVGGSGWSISKIIQLSRDGKKVATLYQADCDTISISSMCYNNYSGDLIVANGDNLLILDLQ